jgi:segregation and condensation protein B
MEVFDSVMALLFVADEPVPTEVLARALALGEGQVEQTIEILQVRLSESGPLQIVRLAGGWQLSTKPECAEIVAAFLKPQRQRLGRSLMEVLAIVAYRQPITMAEVELARGVQSDYSMRQLLERRLVEEVGRKTTPGRPLLYGTTQQFLHQFGLNDLGQLPELSAEITDMAGVAALTVGEQPIEELADGGMARGTEL